MTDGPARLSRDPRSRTPRADAILQDPRVAALQLELGPAMVKQLVREVLDDCRQDLLLPEDVAEQVVGRAPIAATAMRRVINATGVVIHTNLGRSGLSPAAVRAMELAASTVDVELDLATGERGPRGASAIQALLDRVPAANGAHLVNNCAAALALVGAALATRRDVVIARGELVEIGDEFRIPELLEAAGVVLREVGTTNRVHLRDYQDAIGPNTGFVLKVHPSNFSVHGYTSTVDVASLADLRVPLVCDIGSGLLAPHHRLPGEPDATTILEAGADIVVASGDKLLGGPQCGLILARDPVLLQRLKRHPLARALRLDKVRLAALEATLRGPETPTAQHLSADPNHLQERAAAIVAALGPIAEVVDTVAKVGGGGAPDVELLSTAIGLPSHLARPLRINRTQPILGRVHGGRLLLDLIAVSEGDDTLIVQTVQSVLHE